MKGSNKVMKNFISDNKYAKVSMKIRKIIFLVVLLVVVLLFGNDVQAVQQMNLGITIDTTEVSQDDTFILKIYLNGLVDTEKEAVIGIDSIGFVINYDKYVFEPITLENIELYEENRLGRYFI